ncbi:Alpha-1,2 mannosyltransferase [Venturia inaequalis]|nr:Alpha-1,2 mannosyltransferase [Venturia inaequalis]
MTRRLGRRYSIIRSYKLSGRLSREKERIRDD